MNKPAAITAYVDADTLATVEQLAAAQGRSVAEFAAEAIQRAAEGELSHSLEQAERQIDDGAFVTQDEMEAWVAGLRRDAAA